jgi:hypothetical protein
VADAYLSAHPSERSHQVRHGHQRTEFPVAPCALTGPSVNGMERSDSVCPLCAPGLRRPGSMCIVCNSLDASGQLLQPQEEPSQREGQGFKPANSTIVMSEDMTG